MPYKYEEPVSGHDHYCTGCNGYVSNNHELNWCSHCNQYECRYGGHKGKTTDKEIRHYQLVQECREAKRIMDNEKFVEEQLIKKAKQAELQRQHDIVTDLYICTFCNENLVRTLDCKKHQLTTCQCGVKHPDCSPCISEEELISKTKELQIRYDNYIKFSIRGRYILLDLSRNQAVDKGLARLRAEREANPVIYTEQHYEFYYLVFGAIIALSLIACIDMFYMPNSYIKYFVLHYMKPFAGYLIKSLLIALVTLMWTFVGVLSELFMDALFIISFGNISYPHNMWWDTVPLVDLIEKIWTM